MNIRRYYVPNAIVFITQVVYQRTPIFVSSLAVELLLEVLRNVKRIHPFTMLGYVFLPDHFHLLIRPNPPTTHSNVMQSLKSYFTREYKNRIGFEAPMRFWQKRYWDHVIRDEVDFQRHLDYIHFNPVKHGLVTRPEEWPYTSLRHWRERGFYPEGWGWSLPDSIASMDIENEMGE